MSSHTQNKEFSLWLLLGHSQSYQFSVTKPNKVIGSPGRTRIWTLICYGDIAYSPFPFSQMLITSFVNSTIIHGTIKSKNLEGLKYANSFSKKGFI